MKKLVVIGMSVALVVVVLVTYLQFKKPTLGPRPTLGNSTLTLFHVSNRIGDIETCGCKVNPYGGIDREANAVAKARAADPNVLYVDAGNSLSTDDNPHIPMQHRLDKAEAIIGMLNTAKLDVFAPGPQDYKLGLSFLKKLSRQAEFPFLSTNVRSADKAVFEPYVLVDRGNIRYALISLTNPEDLKIEGADIEAPESALNRVLPQLKNQADVIVLVSQLPTGLGRRFGNQYPDIRLVVGANPDYSNENAVWINQGQTLLVDTENRGYRLGELNVSFSFPFKGFTSEVEIAHNLERLKLIEASKTRKGAKRTEYIERFKKMKHVAPIEGGSQYAHKMLKLDKERFGAPNEVTTLMEQYRESVRKKALAE